MLASVHSVEIRLFSQSECHKGFIMDFLLFRRMLTPILIQILFWVGLILCIVTSIYNFVHHSPLLGLQALILGPILVRVFCEFLILFFRINETLTDLKNAVQEKAEGVKSI